MSHPTFYFYDLETSGVNAREARIMQFGGQRTNMDLNPIGEPHNILIKLTDDVVPEPDAILITGITPQQTIQDGVTEAEFLKQFYSEIAVPNTIFVGFNSIRFDDEFMRFLNYRNFYDAYEWQWSDGRSKWDLLDLVRMTRALRPEGIQWPFDSEGKPTNRLELLASINKLSHDNAHDALSDVLASIDLARLIKEKQPKLFSYLLKHRSKTELEPLITSGRPFVYTSGKYPSEFEKTTVAVMLREHPTHAGSVIVYDLRHSPDELLALSAEELAKNWQRRWDEPGIHVPLKTLKYNRCPAVADLAVLTDENQQRLKIDMKVIKYNLSKLQAKQDKLSQTITGALEIMDKKQQTRLIDDENLVDSQLYESFISAEDKQAMSDLRNLSAQAIADYDKKFKDARLNNLLPLYKARNYYQYLNPEDRTIWDTFRKTKLLGKGNESRLVKFFNRLEELSNQPSLSSEKRYLLEELQLYGQSILPDDTL